MECPNEKQIPIVGESNEMTKDLKKSKSTDMPLVEKNRKNRQSAETSDDPRKVPTVTPRKLKNPRGREINSTYQKLLMTVDSCPCQQPRQ